VALQVGGVSDEIVKYGREFCGPISNCTVNYWPALSSERVLQNNKAATVYRKFQEERKIGRGSQMGA
jgi:hypothetical protein